MILKTLSLLMVVSVSFFGNGQHGYFGNRVGIEVGVGTNYSVGKNNRYFYDYVADKDLLLPKLNLGFHVANKNGKVIHWQAIYQPLPNSRISSWSVNETTGTNFNTIDTVWTKSDNLQLSWGFRKFRELAPLGVYFEFQLKSNFVVNKSLYRSEYRVDYTDINYFESSVEYDEFNNVSVIPEVGISIGANVPINDAMTLDVGGKLNVTMGKFKNKGGDYDQIPSSDVYHRILSSRKLFATNLIEVYVNIILFP